MPYRATGTSTKKIQQDIRYIRHVFGLEDVLYFPIIDFVEKILPTVFDDYSFEVASCEEMGNKHGETFPNEHTIKIREDVYLGAIKGMGRDRLTIAHEVGHLFMHDQNSTSFCQLGKGQSLPPYEDPEWQADCFGGEMLAPAYLIIDMNVVEVMENCGVSPNAAMIQLKHAKKFYGLK